MKTNSTVNAAPEVSSKKSEFWLIPTRITCDNSQQSTPLTSAAKAPAFSQRIVRSAPFSGSGFRRRSATPSRTPQMPATTMPISSATHRNIPPDVGHCSSHNASSSRDPKCTPDMINPRNSHAIMPDSVTGGPPDDGQDGDTGGIGNSIRTFGVDFRL